jgi:YVTN family beta-propeller protein
MRARGAHRVRADRRGGTVRWRRVVIITVAAALPLTVVAAAAQPASAAGGYTVTATIGVGSDPDGVAVDSAAGTVYVANSGAGTVSVIDAATNAVTATIGVGSDPKGVAVDPAAGTVYVTNSTGAGTVSVIDAATNALTATIPVGSEPVGVAVDPAVGTVYVANSGAGTVSVIDAATNTVTATIPIKPAEFAQYANPFAVAVDPAAGTVYVTNDNSGSAGTVSVIDVATNAVTATIYVGEVPEGVAVDPAAGTVYATNWDSGSVSVIDMTTNTVTATTGGGRNPSAVAVDPGAGTVYVSAVNSTCHMDCVSVIDVATNAVIDTVPVGAQGVAVDPSTHTAYVTNPGNTVSVISPGQAPAITSARSASIGMRSPADVIVTTTGIPAAAITETGALPKGITFTDNGNGTATFSGNAATGTTGSYPITITASNGVGSPATQAFTLTVTTAASAPAITSAPAAAPLFGALFNFTVTTTGYPVPSISKTGTMPPGVHFAGNGNGTATISGTPNGTALGPYTVTLTAKNKAGTATQSFTLTIWKAPVITKIPTTTATIGTPMHLTITATGYPTPVLTKSGTLPSGLKFTSTGNGQAAISGTPAAGTAGSRAIKITATNQIRATSQTFTLTVRK